MAIRGLLSASIRMAVVSNAICAPLSPVAAVGAIMATSTEPDMA